MAFAKPISKEDYIIRLKQHVEDELRDAYDQAGEEGLDDDQTDPNVPNASQRRIKERIERARAGTTIHDILSPLSEEWDGDLSQLMSAAVRAVVDGVSGRDFALL